MFEVPDEFLRRGSGDRWAYMFRTLGEEISWTLHTAVEAEGEVRKNKIVEGVGKWAEERALSS